jgi:predicted regulator of Ras-like GTPase activity (Roadblock/LC7/MglB family)
VSLQSLVDALVDSVSGAEGALLLDANGEVVVESGDGRERHRLIGAYQGIALARARQLGDRYSIGNISHILSRYSGGQVILRPLNEGYYLLVSLSPAGNVGQGLHRSALAQERLNAEL